VDGDSYFLSNRKNRIETVEARFRVTGFDLGPQRRNQGA
jgi:hypothetical protein